MRKVSIYEVKKQLSQLLARTQIGEEILITKTGVPIAKLVPAVSVNQEEGDNPLSEVSFEPLPDNKPVSL